MMIMPTLLHVSNVDQSIQFYTEVFGLQLLRKQDYPLGRFTIASLGYDDEEPSAIELSHNWGVDDDESHKGRLMLEVENSLKVCDESKYAKGEVICFPFDQLHQNAEALVKDPDGNLIQVIEKQH